MVGMAAKYETSRRSFSIRGLIHQRMRKHCEAGGTKITNYIEDLITNDLDAKGVPVETVLEPRKTKRRPGPPISSQHFTF